jgi:hypothetical protein
MVVGDGAIGTTVDANLYETFSSRGFDVRLADLFERLRVATPSSGSVRFDQGNEARHSYPINCCSIAMPLTEQGAYMATGDLECGWQGRGCRSNISQRDEVQCASMRALRYDILDVLKEPYL